MSIVVPIDNLSDEIRQNVLTNLSLKLQKAYSWVRVFHIDQEDRIYLPFSYALDNGFKRKSRNQFTTHNIEFKGTLRDYQIAVKKQAIEYLNKTGTCILSLHVGWGKSMFAIYLATRLKFKTLIIVNRIILVEQWVNTIEKVCGENTIQFIKTGDVMDPTCCFYIINCQNIPKFSSTYFNDIGTIVCDEVHLLCAKTLFTSFFHLQPRYALALSATPYRPDELSTLIGLFFGKNKIVKKLYRRHSVYTFHTNYELEFKLNYEGKPDWNSILESQSLHVERNKHIVNLTRSLNGRYILILCKRIQHRSELLRMLKESGLDVAEVTSKDKNVCFTSQVLVGTVQKCGVGFDHPKLDTLIIAADMEQYYIQYMGRVFRRPDVNPLIFDFVDRHCSLKKHYLTRKKVYQEAGGKVIDMKNFDMIYQKVK